MLDLTVKGGKISVSIHAPARGAITALSFGRWHTSFNSRTREGCDLDPKDIGRMMEFQFTHPRGVR